MPAKSKSQQRLFGMVHAYQKGELKNPSSEIKSIAKSISKKDAEDFAETKHKGLPNKVKKKKNINESYGIGYGGKFLKSNGWGPTFTSFPEDATKFKTPRQAQEYIDEYLGDDFGASVVSLPLYENRLNRIVSESIRKVLKEEFFDNNNEDYKRGWWSLLDDISDEYLSLDDIMSILQNAGINKMEAREAFRYVTKTSLEKALKMYLKQLADNTSF